MATRKWLSGTYTLGQMSLKNFDVGLFTVSVDGVVHDRRRFFQSYTTEFQITVILLSFGGGLLLVATGSYILFIIRDSGVGVLLFLLTSFSSGIFILAGAVYFFNHVRSGVVQNMSSDISVFLSILSGAIVISNIVNLCTAAKKGELDSDTKAERTRLN
ncbi:hypothetical protein BsWGS_09131 [Bradybaena similaris]